jgi:hypothetical protein
MLDTDPHKRPTADHIRHRFTHMRVIPVQLVSLPSSMTRPEDNDLVLGEAEEVSEKTQSDPVPLQTRDVQPPITTLIRDSGNNASGTTFVHNGWNNEMDFVGIILNYAWKSSIIFLLELFALRFVINFTSSTISGHESTLIRDFVYDGWRVYMKLNIIFFLCQVTLIFLVERFGSSQKQAFMIICGLIVTGVLGSYQGGTDNEIGRMCWRRLLDWVYIWGTEWFWKWEPGDLMYLAVAWTVAIDILVTFSILE